MGDAIGTHGDRLFLEPSLSPLATGTGLGDVASYGEPWGARGPCRPEARVPPTSMCATTKSPVSGLGGFCLCAGFTVCSLFLAFFTYTAAFISANIGVLLHFQRGVCFLSYRREGTSHSVTSGRASAGLSRVPPKYMFKSCAPELGNRTLLGNQVFAC